VGTLRAQLRASSDHAVHQGVRNSVRRWHRIERGVSVPRVTIISAHIVLQEFERILVFRAFEDSFLCMFPYRNLEF
jgi:hypothetical protein